MITSKKLNLEEEEKWKCSALTKKGMRQYETKCDSQRHKKTKLLGFAIFFLLEPKQICQLLLTIQRACLYVSLPKYLL